MENILRSSGLLQKWQIKKTLSNLLAVGQLYKYNAM